MFAASCGQASQRPDVVAVQADGAQGDIVRAIASAAVPLRGNPSDHDRLLAATSGATRILLGESTHGTREYYRERARISERLVSEQDVRAIAIEGDWTPTQRLNLYVRGLGTDRSAEEALRGYTRFPRWMWRNTEFRDFVERLRASNLARPPADRVGLYGMDVYDLFDAADAVVAQLGRVSSQAAQRARSNYRCFAPFRRDTTAYGTATQRGTFSCRREAAAVLAEVRRLARPADPAAAEAYLGLIRSAASVVAAEAYFRTAYGGSLAWNVRDRSMAEAVEDIAAHAAALTGRPGKVAMWSHNTHSGDASATSAANRGELNLGQLMKERHGTRAFALGFFTHSGTVRAAPDWDQPGRVYEVRPALPNSHSDLFHRTGIPAFTLVLRGNAALTSALRGPKLQRAIGVVYRPETERESHYFDADLSRQFDAAIFFDRSSALTPL